MFQRKRSLFLISALVIGLYPAAIFGESSISAPPERSVSFPIQTVGLTPVDNGRLVFDANQGVYWLANANLAGDPVIRATLGISGINPNGTMTFTTALQWVNALNNANGGSGYLGHTNWQLPTVPPTDTTCSVLHGNNGNSFGAHCNESALGNLYNTGLGLTFPNSAIPGFTNTIGLFNNLQPSLYWTSLPESGGEKTYTFLTDLVGSNTTTYNYFYVLPMISGTIGTIGPGTGLVTYTNASAAGKAVYDTATGLTWVLDADLAHSSDFGLTGTTVLTPGQGSPFSVPLINTSGAMLFATANVWLTATNNANYAGASSWSLPAPSDLKTLFSDLNLQPGEARLTMQGNVGPFQNLQPFFYWGCMRDQSGTSRSPCNGSSPGMNMAWSFNLDNGFQATDDDTKAFYVEVYFPASSVLLPIITR